MYLWDKNQENEQVDYSVVSQILNKHSDSSFDSGDRYMYVAEEWKIKMLKKIKSLKINQSKVSCAELRKEFDCFSIFCGQNPLVSK